ncbi:uncharacterized protein LOC135266265 [Tribolium castaneum]|uniref:uncharacterized protein LOC135266265 n=1 Tax=Tribolium castaneum TaxID=7070 RepID=UPI00046C0C2A
MSFERRQISWPRSNILYSTVIRSCAILGGPAQIAGVQASLIRNNSDGTFSLDELRDRIRKNPDCHEPYTTLVIIENTHNMCGGKVLPLDWIEKVKNISKEYNIPVHMDGARVINAAVYLKVPVERVVRDVDTVCFCLSISDMKSKTFQVDLSGVQTNI